MNAPPSRLLGAAVLVALCLSTPAEASAPNGRYTLTSNTTYDTQTKLTWQQAPSSTGYPGANASAYCVLSNFYNSVGWRLPTVKELQTLVDYAKAAGSMIDPTAFPLTPADLFWSVTPSASTPSTTWVVDFASGQTRIAAVTDSHYVRCVHY